MWQIDEQRPAIDLRDSIVFAVNDGHLSDELKGSYPWPRIVDKLIRHVGELTVSLAVSNPMSKRFIAVKPV
jgi:hypothetical protein